MKMYVGNLSFESTENDLQDLFGPKSLAAHPVKAGAASSISESDRSSGYTEQESANVEERLQALGWNNNC